MRLCTTPTLAALTEGGAPGVLAVDDESTEKTMTTFYKAMREVNPREAIRRAHLKVSGDPRFQHPYFWAPFNPSLPVRILRG